MALSDFFKRHARRPVPLDEEPAAPPPRPAATHWGARVETPDGDRGRVLFAEPGDDFVAWADASGRLHFGRRSWLRGVP